jgi:hypothetical protein
MIHSIVIADLSYKYRGVDHSAIFLAQKSCLYPSDLAILEKLSIDRSVVESDLNLLSTARFDGFGRLGSGRHGGDGSDRRGQSDRGGEG